jgi:hypothetical protein
VASIDIGQTPFYAFSAKGEDIAFSFGIGIIQGKGPESTTQAGSS